MGDTAILVEHISKSYLIQQRRYSPGGARRFLNQVLRYGMDLTRIQPRRSLETFQALSNVSFDIKRGEVVGLIGRNGSGKSTLLKVLSRITKPTSGRASIYGRLGSLLEVGTGFHPEMTGRENIYLSGAILGMRRGEISRKLDEIIAFFGNETFIDTPVKRYSSGMYVRLGFAVAAHLDLEILLIDEVLAVGDTEFQKKCLNKMEGASKEGRTVCFVSHNMASVTRLCPRAILLDQGEVVADGPSHQVVHHYMNGGGSMTSTREWLNPSQAPQGETARLLAVRVRTDDSKTAETVDIRRPVLIEMEYEVLKSGDSLLPHYDLYNEEGILIFGTVDVDPAWRQKPRWEGIWISTVLIPGNLLSEGRVSVAVGMTTTRPEIQQFYERDVVGFQITDCLSGESARGDWPGPFDGVVRPLLKWNTEYKPGIHDAFRVRSLFG